MHALILRHLADDDFQTDRCHFQVSRPDGRAADPVEVPAPDSVAVAGRPDSTLSRELRWYLEQFLDYPFAPATEHADRVQAALRTWGEQAFEALFGTGRGRDFYRDAYRDGLDKLTLKIASDDPRVLAWPWEALGDPQAAPLAPTCQMERQLSAQHDPLPLPDNLPRDRINILLVTARPYEADVGFRSLSRPLLELIEREKLPAAVEMLRPPTFDRLRQRLADRPGYYHIVHFDGHGGYGSVAPGDGHQYRQGRQGKLVFETEDGAEDLIEAETLATLLRDYRVPIMVLNACQSAMIDDQAENAFASVAAALQRAGVRSVVAMAYSLYVSAARVFIPPFYQRLFQCGSVTEATRAGRQALLRDSKRTCVRGEFPLEDWLVPVVYQQDPPQLAFAGQGRGAEAADQSALPPEVQEDNPYGFIGRDSALLALERALRRPPPGILIHGLGGVGKTTLARGLVRWLHDTGGLEGGCLWFGFDDIRSSEYVFNRLVEKLFGVQATAAPLEQKLEALKQALRDRPLLLVWDNFESVQGNPEAGIEPMLPAEDRAQLRDFLYGLRGGKTKVLITSRSQESGWLNRPNCYRLPLGGLQGEERWDYCNAIVRDLGLRLKRSDPTIKELLDLLDGHPLAMRAMLVQLAEQDAAGLTRRLRERLEQQDGADEAQIRLFATLGFVTESLPDELRPLLVPLALHERFVDADYWEQMAETAQAPQDRQAIDRLLNALETAGLVHPFGQGIYGLHPALTGFLRAEGWGQAAAGDESWRRAFVDFMGWFANQLAPKQLHKQREQFYLYGANFHSALRQAEALKMENHVAMIIQVLAANAFNCWDFINAQCYFEQLIEKSEKNFNFEGEASAYHQLGNIFYFKKEYSKSTDYYLTALNIWERLDHKKGAASTYSQLGIIFQEQKNYLQAKEWYFKSLAIWKNLDCKHGIAITYHRLGMVAGEQRNYIQAEKLYLKSLAISKNQGNEQDAALTYHHLGMIAGEQRNYIQAEQWYLKSLAISEKQGDKYGAAGTYHQLGTIAQEQRNYPLAEKFYHKSLAISEKQVNEHGAAMTYGQLGLTAQKQGDYFQAEQWYQKSIYIKEKQGDEYGAAGSYHNLGTISQEQQDYSRARAIARKITTLTATWSSTARPILPHGACS